MTDRKTMTDAALDAILADAAARAPDPLPERLRARLVAEALARMPAKPAATRRGLRLPARLAWLWQPLGGAPGLGAMTAAGIAGLWIGAAAPEPVAGVSSAFWQGAALLGPELAEMAGDDPFDDDPLLSLLADD